MTGNVGGHGANAAPSTSHRTRTPLPPHCCRSVHAVSADHAGSRAVIPLLFFYTAPFPPSNAWLWPAAGPALCLGQRRSTAIAHCCHGPVHVQSQHGLVVEEEEAKEEEEGEGR